MFNRHQGQNKKSSKIESAPVLVIEKNDPKENPEIALNKRSAEINLTKQALEAINTIEFEHNLSEGVVDTHILEQFERNDVDTGTTMSQVLILENELRSYDLSSFEASAQILTQTLLSKLEQWDCKGISSLDEITDLIHVAQPEVKRMKQFIQTFSATYKTLNALGEIYNAKLLRENHHEKLTEEIIALTSKINFLEKGLGRIKNPAEIKKLKEEKKTLNNVSSKMYWPTGLPTFRYGQLSELTTKIENVHLQIVQKIADYYRQKCNQISVESVETFKLNAETVTNLNKAYIAQYIFPIIEQTKISLAHTVTTSDPSTLVNNETKQLEQLNNPELPTIVEGLFMKAFSIQNASTNSDLRHEFTQQLPLKLALPLLDMLPKSQIPSDLGYSAIGNTLKSIQTFYEIQQLDSIKTMLLVHGDQTYKINHNYHIGDKARRFEDDIIKLKEQKQYNHRYQCLTTEIDLKQWNVFKANKQIQLQFPKAQIDFMNRSLEHERIKAIIGVGVYGDKEITTSERALDLHTPKAAPYVILNCFRIVDSNQNPLFLRFKNDCTESDLYNYIKGFTPNDLDIIEQSKIPGLAQFFRLVKSNPESFINPRTFKRVTPDSILEAFENPIYHQIHESLQAMCVHLLKQSNSEAEFAISAYGRLEGETELDAKTEIIKLLQRTTHHNHTADRVLGALSIRAVKGDRGVAEAVIEAWPTLKQDTKGDVGQMKHELFGCFIKTDPTERELQTLSEILNISPDAIKDTLLLLRQMPSILPYWEFSFEVVRSMTYYIDLAPHRTKFIELMKDLEPCNYRFVIDDTPLFIPVLSSKEPIDIVKTHKSFVGRLDTSTQFESKRIPEYIKLSKLPNLDERLALFTPHELATIVNDGLYFKIFADVKAEKPKYDHIQTLIHDSYFKENKDHTEYMVLAV